MRHHILLLAIIFVTFYNTNAASENDVTYYLFTQKNQENPIQVTKQDVELHLNSSAEIVLLIHGWRGSRNVSWYPQLKDAYMSRNDTLYNVIEVDWSGPASNLMYPFTADVSRNIVGKIIGAFIVQMINNGVSPNNIHVIGHSLGGQVAGIAGQEIFSQTGKKVRRITGLDPAAPSFVGEPASNRLSPDDAKIVTVIHTDGGVFGYLSVCGTIDFFPNGGKPPQPGCLKEALPDLLELMTSCSHSRSHDYFIEAITNPGSFIGTKCGNLLEFETSMCANGKKLDMAKDFTDEDQGSYFLTTNNQPPYGKGA